MGDGYESLMTADYSQIEMRIMADLSEDAVLIEAFQSGRDFHSTYVEDWLQFAGIDEIHAVRLQPSSPSSPGIDERVAAANPRLIRVAITGYGPDGPRAADPAFDTAIQAYCGLMTHQGGAEEPKLVRTYIADKTTSTFAVQGVLDLVVVHPHEVVEPAPVEVVGARAVVGGAGERGAPAARDGEEQPGARDDPPRGEDWIGEARHHTWSYTPLEISTEDRGARVCRRAVVGPRSSARDTHRHVRRHHSPSGSRPVSASQRTMRRSRQIGTGALPRRGCRCRDGRLQASGSHGTL